MSLIQKAAFRCIDWKRVQKLSIDGRKIHLLTDAGARDIEFETEQEALDAIQGWVVSNSQPVTKAPQGMPPAPTHSMSHTSRFPPPSASA